MKGWKKKIEGESKSERRRKRRRRKSSIQKRGGERGIGTEDVRKRG